MHKQNKTDMYLQLWILGSTLTLWSQHVSTVSVCWLLHQHSYLESCHMFRIFLQFIRTQSKNNSKWYVPDGSALKQGGVRIFRERSHERSARTHVKQAGGILPTSVQSHYNRRQSEKRAIRGHRQLPENEIRLCHSLSCLSDIIGKHHAVKSAICRQKRLIMRNVFPKY